MNDVNFTNNDLYISQLGRSGVVLDNAYTLPVCSPSRAAFLTGIYPFKMGLQVAG